MDLFYCFWNAQASVAEVQRCTPSVSEGTPGCNLLLNTKYYSCILDLRSFKDIDEAHVWNGQRGSGRIGAVIYRFFEESSEIPQIKDAFAKWNAETQARNGLSLVRLYV